MLSDADEARRIEIERDYRRQVRKAWYLREEDFDSLKEYNDYLEETEARPHGCTHPRPPLRRSRAPLASGAGRGAGVRGDAACSARKA